MTDLICLLDGREVGRVSRDKGRLSFAYARSWRSAPGAYPLSLSMPLAAQEYPHGAIEPFLWGLLPDNDLVLRRWASTFHVSPRNVFGIIAQVGEDCAGAVQFMTSERFEALRAETAPRIDWLTETDVAARLRALRDDAAAVRAPRDLGQFSLAGAQPKTAFLFDGRRWGVPAGRTPTTHILKPTTAEFDGHAENEHVCLSLARALGLPTAQTEVRRFEDVTAIVATRYDRVDTARLAAAAVARAAAAANAAALAAISDVPKNIARVAQSAADSASAAADAQVMEAFSKSTPIYRVHQEDLCQALGVHPSRKYQNEGGPGPREILDLLRASVRGGRGDARREDLETFVDALVFNWLIGGTDAHTKNYALLLGGDGMVRLAPLYDVASIFAYAGIDPRKAKLAMKIGGEYRLQDVTWTSWRRFAASMGLPVDGLVDRARAMATNLPDALADEIATARRSGIDHPVLDRLAATLTDRARHLAAS
jgi:serine/threonine-protein kinase HipA